MSCSNHAYGHFNAYRRVAERADLDLVVHLGDYLYEYGPNEYGSTRTPEPPNEIVTLTDYRLRHAQYKRDADLREAHRQHPMIAIWDDHETANDAWVDGAQNLPKAPKARGPRAWRRACRPTTNGCRCAWSTPPNGGATSVRSGSETWPIW